MNSTTRPLAGRRSARSGAPRPRPAPRAARRRAGPRFAAEMPLHRPHRPQPALGQQPRRARPPPPRDRAGSRSAATPARSPAARSSASRTRSSRATRSCAVSPSAIISSGEAHARARLSQTERTALPRRAMSSENEVSSDSACSTLSTRGATKVPEPRRCTSRPACDQRLHRLAHRHPAEAGQRRHARAPAAGSRPAAARPPRSPRRSARVELQVERPRPVVGEGSGREERAHPSLRASASAPSSPLPRGARISPP